MAISVTGGQETWLRLCYDVSSYSFASALVIVARWINTLTYIKVEASSYSDFSADVVSLYEASPQLSHWDNTSVHVFSTQPGGRRYIRITIGAVRSTDGQFRFRELILLTYGDVNRMWEGYFPFDWDYTKRVKFQNTVFPSADNALDIGTTTYRWRNLELAGYGNLGSLRIGGTEVITSGRVLQNVSADASIITSGTLAWERISGNFPRTIAELLTDHNRAAHDALGTGAVVYTDESQTLLNKTLQNPLVKDVAATPVGDILLKNVSQVLHVRDSGDTAYKPVDVGSVNVGGTEVISSDRNIHAVNVYASNLVQVGDLGFKNGWRFTEDEKHGLVLVSPEGKRYRIKLEEVD